MRKNQLFNDQKKIVNHSLKLEIMNNYFINKQKQFDQAFMEDIFRLANEDSQMESIIQQNAQKILLSCQQIASSFLLKLLSLPNFRPIAVNFLKDLIYLNLTIHNKPFELFIIQNLLQILTFKEFSNQQALNSALVYLALKIRSFDLIVKLTALKALKKLAEELEEKAQYAQAIFKEIIPQMIEKEKLVKEVSYTKGLFLHALQDEFSEMRMNCIKILMLFRRYFKPYELKTIIIYMLNDQHEIVREQALIATKSLVDQPFNKEDLETILMCLKEKRANMRKLVYQTLSAAQLNQPSLLILLTQKVFTTLLIYKTDKKSIYKMLFRIGERYTKIVGNLLQKLSVIEDQQPNWKNIAYKGKMILCYHWWNNLQSTTTLPNYFSRHMLYIRDVQSYLFSQKCNMDLQPAILNIHNLPLNQLLRFVQCEESLSEDFHKTILNVIYQVISGNIDQRVGKILEQLQLQYDLSSEDIALKDFVQELLIQKQQGRSQKSVSAIKKCLQSREKYEKTDSQIKKNKCAISKMQPNCVISSKSRKFQERIYLKCLKHHLISSTPKVEYKRLVECLRTKEDENFDYWSLKLSKYSKIQCVIKISDNKQQVLDTYEMDYRG